MSTAPESWKQNLEAKVIEVQNGTLSYVSKPNSQKAEAILASLSGLSAMFASEFVPHEAMRFRECFQAYVAQANAETLRHLLVSHSTLPNIGQFAEDGMPTFDEIFDSYKNDDALSSLLADVVALIERLIVEGDDVLSAQLERELSVVLKHIKRRDSSSLYELKSWLDLSLKTVMRVIEVHQGWFGLSTAYEAAKILIKTRENLVSHYNGAQLKLAHQHKMTGVEKGLEASAVLPNTVEEFATLMPPEVQTSVKLPK